MWIVCWVEAISGMIRRLFDKDGFRVFVCTVLLKRVMDSLYIFRKVIAERLLVLSLCYEFISIVLNPLLLLPLIQIVLFHT